MHYIRFLNVEAGAEKVTKESSKYTEASNNANRWQGFLGALIRQADEEDKAEQQKRDAEQKAIQNNIPNSIAGE